MKPVNGSAVRRRDISTLNRVCAARTKDTFDPGECLRRAAGRPFEIETCLRRAAERLFRIGSMSKPRGAKAKIEQAKSMPSLFLMEGCCIRKIFFD